MGKRCIFGKAAAASTLSLGKLNIFYLKTLPCVGGVEDTAFEAVDFPKVQEQQLPFELFRVGHTLALRWIPFVPPNNCGSHNFSAGQVSGFLTNLAANCRQNFSAAIRSSLKLEWVSSPVPSDPNVKRLAVIGVAYLMRRRRWQHTRHSSAEEQLHPQHGDSDKCTQSACKYFCQRLFCRLPRFRVASCDCGAGGKSPEKAGQGKGSEDEDSGNPCFCCCQRFE